MIPPSRPDSEVRMSLATGVMILRPGLVHVQGPSRGHAQLWRRCLRRVYARWCEGEERIIAAKCLLAHATEGHRRESERVATTCLPQLFSGWPKPHSGRDRQAI